MTNYNERLDEIIRNIRGDDYGPMNYGSYAEAKQAIIDWHNKQIEAKLAHISEYAENVISIDENGEFSMKAIPLSLVAVERNKLNPSKSTPLNKLKETKNDQL